MLKSSQRGNVGLGLLYLALIIAAAYGYISNLVSVVLFFAHDMPFGSLIVGRVIGLFFAPLGMVLGYF